jgi:hypothetical protein
MILLYAIVRCKILYITIYVQYYTAAENGVNRVLFTPTHMHCISVN